MIPDIHFYYRLSRPQEHRAAGRFRSIEIFYDLIENRTRVLLACSIVPQPTMLPSALPQYDFLQFKNIFAIISTTIFINGTINLTSDGMKRGNEVKITVEF
jgi:hypothetical protein